MPELIKIEFFLDGVKFSLCSKRIISGSRWNGSDDANITIKKERKIGMAFNSIIQGLIKKATPKVGEDAERKAVLSWDVDKVLLMYVMYIVDYVHHYNRLYFHTLNENDLFQAGSLGLTKAMIRFNNHANKDNLKFIWIARYEIQNAMLSEISATVGYTSVSRSVKLDKVKKIYIADADIADVGTDGCPAENRMTSKDTLNMLIFPLKDDKEKAIIRMIYDDGLNFAEIAEKLHCSRQNIDLRFKRVRNKILSYYLPGWEKMSTAELKKQFIACILS